MTMATRTLDVAAIRKDFPIFETGIAYLDSANTSQRPKQVTGAMMEYFEKFNSNIHRAAYRIAEEATVRYEATREKVRAFINAASTKEIIYTRGTTEAINLVAYAWGRKNIKKDDLIVLTILDHHSNIVPWQIMAAEKGAHIEYVDIADRGEQRLRARRADRGHEPLHVRRRHDQDGPERRHHLPRAALEVRGGDASDRRGDRSRRRGRLPERPRHGRSARPRARHHRVRVRGAERDRRPDPLRSASVAAR